MAMTYALEQIMRYNYNSETLTWSNVWHESEFTIGMKMVLMMFTSFMFLMVTLYVERVLPGTYGVSEPWYFLFSKRFWFGNQQDKDISVYRNDAWIDGENFEEEPRDRNVGIRIHKLRKVFDSGTVAVADLSFNMYENQITVLLGHNGAGKSTSILMLAGMLPSTSGTALINGYDIRTETKKARSSIGLCTQQNILFDELTVREHIQFFCGLKGLDSVSANRDTIKYVDLLGLGAAIDKASSTLSGGMKRKLSLAIALCGDSQFVLCDEPSSGMDPQSRQDLWRTLQCEKEGRSILLTTHYMDEADVLGDRIAM